MQKKLITEEGQRWLVSGPTGCGKTTFSKELAFKLLEMFNNHRLYILNSKVGDDFIEFGNNYFTNGSLPRILKNSEFMQVWTPLKIIPDNIEIWLNRILHDGPCILYIDELIHLKYGRNWSDKYDEINKIGRSKKISVITNTQWLTQLPRTTISQATHFVQFNTVMPYEKQLTRQLLRSEQKILNLPLYNFYYGNLTNLEPYRTYSHYNQLIRSLKVA